MIVSDAIGEKALRLVEEKRVRTRISERLTDQFLVSGDSGFHSVVTMPEMVWCDCEAWREDRYCSHAVAVMLVCAGDDD